MANTETFKFVADVADPVSVAAAFQSIFKQHKRLDAMVANAGVLKCADRLGNAGADRTHFLSEYFWRALLAQYAARLMVKSGGGSIVTVSSIIGTHGAMGQAVYAGSKAAVIGITKSLAKGTRTSTSAGECDCTWVHRHRYGPFPYRREFAEWTASIGMGRVGSASEIADAALFLVSDLSCYITGTDHWRRRRYGDLNPFAELEEFGDQIAVGVGRTRYGIRIAV